MINLDALMAAAARGDLAGVGNVPEPPAWRAPRWLRRLAIRVERFERWMLNL